MTRDKARKITREAEEFVYTNSSDITQGIFLHASMAMEEMEIFVETKLAKKMKIRLEKKGFYVRLITFKSLPNECKMYVSWISNLA